jgi:DUF1680 family protein
MNRLRAVAFVVTIIIWYGLPEGANGQGYLVEKDNQKVKVKPAVAPAAFGFNLADVKLLPGSPFYNAMEKDAAYLLSLEPARLLHRFYLNSGLKTKGEVYGGWESEGLSGHTLGHYLSACAMMYASTGDERFKEQVDRTIDELKVCQDARGTGYVGAIPKEDSIFWKLQHGIIKTSGFDLNGGWSPWYTVHKVMAGLADAYIYADNGKALKILVGMSDWAADILKDLNEEQLENMRKCEYGGMNDILVHVYELTGDRKYLDLSYKFHDRFVMGQLAKKIDPLPGKHSNTNVPKAIGSARRYFITAADSDRVISSFFWETMVKHHTYVIGGNSNYEYCGDQDKLNERLSDNTCETCNTYNMLKLTRQLFAVKPTADLGNFYERALYNHILASQNPDDGMMCYFVPLRMGTKKEFSDPFNTFTCCVGSGMENHSKYAEGIYYESKAGDLLVNLFIPSELNWRSKGVVLKQESKFPEGDEITFTVTGKATQRFNLLIRNPHWLTTQPTFSVNGKSVKLTLDASGFWNIDRQWRSNDVLKVKMPMALRSESMPDNPNRIALLYGPVVLAGQLGKTMPDPIFGTSVLLTSERDVTKWATATAGDPLKFNTSITRPDAVTMIPFYATNDEYYNVYWDYFTENDWTKRQAEYESEKKRSSKIEQRTIDIMRLGEMQPERDHNLKASERSYTSDALGRMGREVRSGGFFEFDMIVLGDTPGNLLCTYIGDDKNRAFDLLIDGVKIGTQELTGGTTGRFFDVEYPIPAELTKGKGKVVVRVQAHPNKTAGRVFGCRIVKKQF